jgi:hypothetical protein
MKTTNRILLAIVFFSATLFHTTLGAQVEPESIATLDDIQNRDVIAAKEDTKQKTDRTIKGVVPKKAFLKAQKKFDKKYSTQSDIVRASIAIRVDDIKETWFNAQQNDSVNGLVFHYDLNPTNDTVHYLVGLGFVEGSELIKFSPFPQSDDEDFNNPHYYKLNTNPNKSYKIIQAKPDQKDLYELHNNYDVQMNRKGLFNVFNRDVKNIKRHPNMIHYPFDSLKVFYDEYNDYQECYYLEDTAAGNLENPELFLFISTVAYDGGKLLNRNFHTPILMFGSANGAFVIDDNDYGKRRYKNKAYDVGVLCPPNCPSIIWPSN